MKEQANLVLTSPAKNELYPLECYLKKSSNIDFKVGDKVEFKKQFGIKGLKVYDQAYKVGKIDRISNVGSIIKCVIRDNNGINHFVNSKQIRPFIKCEEEW